MGALLGCLALAQGGGTARMLVPAGLAARAHATVTADFKVEIENGFHIQSNRPKLDYLIPTELNLTPADGVSVLKVAWPKATEHTFAFAPKQPLSVFEGTVVVPVTLKTGAAGTATLHGSFRYQACNDELCKPPVTVPITLTLRVR